MAIIKLTHKGLSMKKTTVSIFGIVAMTAGLWATVPYTFTPNTPAKASEVNANFQALSNKITTLEGNVSDVVSGGVNCDASPFTYTYTYTPSNIGDVVNINGVEYIIVAHPFLEYGTGDHYSIKYPMIKNQFDKNGMLLQWGTNYVVDDTSCYPYTYANYPSSTNEIRYSTSYHQWYGSDFTITEGTSFFTTIKINKTKLDAHINWYSAPVKEVSREPYTPGDYDLTDNIDWSKLGVDNTLVEDVKTLMNYVEIVKIP